MACAPSGSGGREWSDEILRPPVCDSFSVLSVSALFRACVLSEVEILGVKRSREAVTILGLPSRGASGIFDGYRRTRGAVPCASPGAGPSRGTQEGTQVWRM